MSEQKIRIDTDDPHINTFREGRQAAAREIRSVIFGFLAPDDPPAREYALRECVRAAERVGGLDPAGDQTGGEPDEGRTALRARYVEGLAFESTAWGPHRPPWLLRDTIEKIADAVLAVRDDEMDALRARVADYENTLTWNTTCRGCAAALDSAYAETRRAEQAEAERERVYVEMQTTIEHNQKLLIGLLHGAAAVARVRGLVAKWALLPGTTYAEVAETLLAALPVPADGEQPKINHTEEADRG